MMNILSSFVKSFPYRLCVFTLFIIFIYILNFYVWSDIANCNMTNYHHSYYYSVLARFQNAITLVRNIIFDRLKASRSWDTVRNNKKNFILTVLRCRFLTAFMRVKKLLKLKDRLILYSCNDKFHKTYYSTPKTPAN